MQLGAVEAALVVGVTSELLREAFQHCLESDPQVEVILSEEPVLRVTVANSCPIDAEGAKAEGGNQASTLRAIMSRLPNWHLSVPGPTGGQWVRSLSLNLNPNA